MAKMLRKNMTPQEKRLWYDYLRTYPIKVLRQKIIGHYVADFYCAKAGLVIELDGSQHFRADYAQADASRTDYLENLGIEVLRIPNNEIDENFVNACDYIDAVIRKRIGDEDTFDSIALSRRQGRETKAQINK